VVSQSPGGVTVGIKCVKRVVSACRLLNSGKRIPIRVFVSNESGYYLDITMYKEVTDEKTGQVGAVSHAIVSLLNCVLQCFSAAHPEFGIN